MSLAVWEIRYRRTDAPEDAAWIAAPLVPAVSGGPRVDGLEVGVAYDLRVRYIDEDGDASEESSILGHVVGGAEMTPPNPADLVVSGESCVRWRAPALGGSVTGFQIRYGLGEVDDWEALTPAHEGLWPAPPFPLCGLPGGLLTLAVAAVGPDGRTSVTPAMLPLVLDELDARQAVVLHEESEAAKGWPGELLGGTVSGGEVVGDVDAGAWYGPEPVALYGEDAEDAEYGPDDGADLYGPAGEDARAYGPADGDLEYGDDVFEDLVYHAEVRVPAHAGVAEARLTVGLVTVGSARLEYRHAEDLYGPLGGAEEYGAEVEADEATEAYGTDVPTAWRPWPGRLERPSAGIYEFRVTVLGGEVEPRISSLTAAVTRAA